MLDSVCAQIIHTGSCVLRTMLQQLRCADSSGGTRGSRYAHQVEFRYGKRRGVARRPTGHWRWLKVISSCCWTMMTSSRSRHCSVLPRPVPADDPDMLYSDEVLVGEDGKTVRHFIFRPMFSPEYLRCHPCIVHLIGSGQAAAEWAAWTKSCVLSGLRPDTACQRAGRDDVHIRKCSIAGASMAVRQAMK